MWHINYSIINISYIINLRQNQDFRMTLDNLKDLIPILKGQK